MSKGMGEFLNNIYDYLSKKFPDAPLTAIDEASGYIVSRAMVEVSDAIQDRDRMWREDILGDYEPKKYPRIRIRRRSEDSTENV